MTAEQLASVVVAGIKAATAPLEARVAVLEAAAPMLHKSVDAMRDDGAAVRERVAILESRPPLPGPAGEKGADGQDGKDGAPGLAFKGLYADDYSYDVGDIVRWGGSTYHCVKATTGLKPDARAAQMSAPDGSLEFRGVNGAECWELFVSKGDPGRAAK